MGARRVLEQAVRPSHPRARDWGLVHAVAGKTTYTSLRIYRSSSSQIRAKHPGRLNLRQTSDQRFEGGGYSTRKGKRWS